MSDPSSSLDGFCGEPLWRSDSRSGLPNVSVCFQHTILVWVPAIYLALLFPLFIFQSKLISRRTKPLPLSPHLIAKMAVSILLCVAALFQWCCVFISDRPRHTVDYVYPGVWTVSLFFSLLMHIGRRWSGMVTSGIQHIYHVILAVCCAPEMYEWIRRANDLGMDSSVVDVKMCVSFWVFYGLLILETILMCLADARSSHDKISSRELDSSFVSRLTLWWFNPIPFTGAKKDLEISDLFDLNEGNTTDYLTEQWERCWNKRLNDYEMAKKAWKEGDKEVPLPSVAGCLFDIFKWEILSAGGMKIISDCLQFANPFLLNQLISFVSDKDAPLWQGVAYAILMFTASECRSFVLNSYFYVMFRLGVKFQTSLTAAVYQKTLKLSNSARRDKTVGEIVNLMAIDVERFQTITWQLHQFWSCPFQIILALSYLFYILGYSVSPGLVVMILFVPLNICASVAIKRWQVDQMKLKDERTKMINEVLNGIKVIKLYAWEVPMEQLIDSIRQKELRLLKFAAVLRSVVDAFNNSSPFLVAASSFSLYTLSSPDHYLTPQIAFVALTLFNQLRSPMGMVALLINMTVQTLVSNKRLKEFFVADELVAVVKRSDDKSVRNCVELSGVNSTWDEGEERETTLQDLNLCVERGSLTAVVGRVGSGKSSLLATLLGEMNTLSGTIGVHGTLAYVPQQPWIQNLSVRENILFGKKFNKRFYDQVVYACALSQDFKILPQGDRTEIGEKGINLSGGQKARVSLARAIYQNYDVYLLDDPLSAVDTHVGRHIFEKVIGPNGLLRGKTRILVTHGLHYIKHTSQVVVLDGGRIAEMGAYSDLIKQDDGVLKRILSESDSNGSGNDKDGESRSSAGEEENVDDYSEHAMPTLESIDLPADDLPVHVAQSIELPSLTSSEKEKKLNESEKLIKKEFMESGQVKMTVYGDYVKAASYPLSILFIAAFIAYQALQVGRSFWLSAWSDEAAREAAHSTESHLSLALRLSVYIGIGLAESLSFFSSLFVLVFGGVSASRQLHAPLIANILRSPMSFFDTTPLGRILNRCAKDIEVVDTQIPLNFRYFVGCIVQVISTLIIIVVSTPLFAAVIIPLALIYFLILKFYVPTSRQLKRLESTNRSPIYSQFGESIQGAATIRAFGKVAEARALSGSTVDRFIRCKNANIVANRWLAVRLEFIGNCVIFFAALFAAFSKHWGWMSSAGVVGVSISYALNITEVLNFAVRQISEIEANIVSVERIKEYTETPNEAAWEIAETKPKDSWPDGGQVTFSSYSTRYRAGLDLVLRGISARVERGEKIGIVGRTGAGKSSFALALFRMIEAADGGIEIDGVNASEIGLHALRSKLSIIPQDPVLFSGSLRFNLDPFGAVEDNEIWRSLELAHLKEFAASLVGGLDYVISEGGENISVGQRQLVCLARALLRRSKILVLDEATAAVDMATDALIQTTIREQFDSCTVFTIAHRLNTILDYDRIMVLDSGEIREFDSPSTLLADRNSLFSAMVADARQQESHQ